MKTPILADAFGHHVWASLRLIESCEDLSAEQLASSVPGTYGSVLDTLRHLVGSDRWYLYRIGGERATLIDEDRMDLSQLRAAMEENGVGWTEVVDGEPDPDAMIVTRREDDSETHAALGIRLAQVLHHGTDHRSQVCTALTALGLEPPEIDAWAYGAEVGRTTEFPATMPPPP